ncbi:alpha/beta fold hydrolase [Companilactobacillus halodurans]|uniref:Alpha/beta hydrolase n=1 Tax=Companilactobacillus halodurans TaxID=2584183 RepID=A0A5P0ZNK5_9LACO|nr:alpha/beta hydrolase [Companilactobacillus halodurans]MQS75807.1 alpha/beta hydrolase [Companilactobacillus halodurans]MQS97982.1 alpha/beta hydrolase [Companilactobacillus halodurans]
MKFLTNDKIKLDYQDSGSGQPVILVEGFGGYQEVWQAQVEYLLEMNCRVITYDHRNQGKSQRTDKNLTIEQLVNDLASLIDYLQIKKPILIGHSMGASICYAYLSKYRNVKTVMAIDQSPKMLNGQDWQYGFEDITQENFKAKVTTPNGIHETLHGLDSRISFDLNKVKANYPFDRDKDLPLLFDHIQKDWRDTVLNTKVPINLVVAKESPYFNYRFAQLMSEKNPCISQVVIDDCGHDIMAEVPDIFNQTLRHFIFQSKRKK